MAIELGRALRLAVCDQIVGRAVDVGMHRHQATLDQVGLGRTVQADRDVGLPHAEVHLAVGDDERERYLGIAVEELTQMRGEPERPDPDGSADPKEARRDVPALAQRRLHRRHALRELARRLEQDLALLGQHQAAGMTMEERRAQVLLERADLPADRRLAEAKAVGGTREAAGLGDGVKDANAIPVEHAGPSLFSSRRTRCRRQPGLSARRPRSPPGTVRPRVPPCTRCRRPSRLGGTPCPGRRPQRKHLRRWSACCRAR